VDALAQRGYNVGHKIGEGSYATVITAGYADDTGHGVHLACKKDEQNCVKTMGFKYFYKKL